MTDDMTAVRRGSEILGAGYYQPATVLTNHELESMVETNDEWIRQRTGIRERRIASDEETVPMMATAAARDALANAGIDASVIDLIVVATVTSEQRSPNTAGRVAVDLDAPSPVVIDINVACSGYVHALAIADQAIKAGTATTALVIASEKLSAVTDWTDRSTCILVADAAAAFVIRRSSRPGISTVTWGTEPELVDAVAIEPPTNKFAQDGKSVFKWAISEAAGYAAKSVTNAGYRIDELGGLISHQANLRIIEPLARQLGMADKIVATDVVTSGNTSAASIPLAFAKMWQAGELPPDTPFLLFAFGGGFAYAGLVARTPRPR
ncbi:beta-ketoacyl-[acyl-carrier-protein] synthase III [Microlunatus endophyticus]|uniref:Beta-ketoacyl-[acyl-carrier-protein] synthase III n=1 Tax=Microlunatus endophyticus TaxID=1716077 RepID=A0A917SJD2_9ACTN|nr:beta-ketoacyl-ACP synthase 3 [Microlunatus endophyticus]GGL82557.1 beta-ketoacyl-[acyl-carrier-protein] synthase III [Microlunatus endophyticus]